MSTAPKLQFGFFAAAMGSNAFVDVQGIIAERKLPGHNDNLAGGVVYGSRPLRGRSKFEVEILRCSHKYGTLKIGIARHRPRGRYTIPQIAETAEGHLVWLGDGIYSGDKELLPSRAKKFSTIDLHDVCHDCKIGFDLRSNGTLSFTINGQTIGIAANNVFKEGYEVRPVVDLFGGCRVRITEALTKIGVEHFSLQDRCIEVIADSLHSRSEVEELPLPSKFKEKIMCQVPLSPEFSLSAQTQTQTPTKKTSKLKRFFFKS